MQAFPNEILPAYGIFLTSITISESFILVVYISELCIVRAIIDPFDSSEATRGHVPELLQCTVLLCDGMVQLAGVHADIADSNRLLSAHQNYVNFPQRSKIPV